MSDNIQITTGQTPTCLQQKIDKKIPILRMWHTSFYQGKIEPLQGYSNKIIGKLCAKCREEMKQYNLI